MPPHFVTYKGRVFVLNNPKLSIIHIYQIMEVLIISATVKVIVNGNEVKLEELENFMIDNENVNRTILSALARSKSQKDTAAK